jgi:predicted nucleotide-binding protein
MALPDSSSEPTSVLKILRKFLQIGEKAISGPNVPRGQVIQLSRVVRSQLATIYGKDSPELAHFPMTSVDLPEQLIRPELSKRVEQLRRTIAALEALPQASVSPTMGKRVYIGHGRSPLWRELKDFVADRLRLPWDEFNRESVAGLSTLERLEAMRAEAAFAFLVMTAEEQHADDSIHARPNVIHEVGLFQGSLGPRRAIVMLEEGCSEFSNIIGVSQIRFPHGNIAAKFEEVRRVLEREGLIRA